MVTAVPENSMMAALEKADNRLIRPRANYVGHDERDFVALDAR